MPRQMVTNKPLDYMHKGRLWGRRARCCLKDTSRATAAAGAGFPVSADEIPIARRMQHKTFIQGHLYRTVLAPRQRSSLTLETLHP